MLRPHPAVLRRLVDEYEALSAAEAAGDAVEPSSRARDLEYTLCVSTGTREVRDALEAAYRWLAPDTTPTTPKTLSPRETAPPRAAAALRKTASVVRRPAPVREVLPVRETVPLSGTASLAD
ncbi:DUF5133 domain-containing protein [Streptomyces sp. NPDC085946]|uniref:DUF5133 domain-containing protein n=1 Tax=Streptomyces sp. NPDC085946 TaxID=3365744 RepID=UPI0037D0837D